MLPRTISTVSLVPSVNCRTTFAASAPSERRASVVRAKPFHETSDTKSPVHQSVNHTASSGGPLSEDCD